ncbi:hypothetical protein [Megasphaera sp.]|uniref:hypothetical protein n=1 Tax=Megasphaera sp. TaxID=2023260 RepID=UPI0040270558
MNTLNSAFSKRRRQRRALEIEAGAESGTDWATTLLFNCLHDKYGFGRRRFAAMLNLWNDLDKYDNADILQWRDELEQYGFDRMENERMAARMQKMITGNSKDRALIAHTRDMLAGCAIVVFHTMLTTFGWKKKRISDLFQYYKDKVFVLTHNEVPIWEFMKCLHVECGIDYPALTAYEKQNGPVDIYHGNRGAR